MNGLCYLATFVFGINAVGLFLYSGQLAINSVMEEGSKDEPKATGDKQVSPPNSTVETTLDSTESNSSNDDQSSSNLQ